MTAPQLKRRWYQFSLLSLLVLMTLAAGGLGIFACQQKRNRQRQAAISRIVGIIENYGGYVVEGEDFTFSKRGLEGEELRMFLDDLQWWDNPRQLHLEEFKVTDQNMKQIAKLRTLEGLKLRDSQITDAGLRELSSLTNLTWINIENCAVTDAGLKHISKLSKLKYLETEGTQITPAGEKWVKEILPNLEINPKFGNAARMAEP